MVWLIKSSQQLLLDSLSNQHHGVGNDNVRKRHTTVLRYTCSTQVTFNTFRALLPFLQRLPVPHVAFSVMKLLPVLLLTQRKVKGAAIAAGDHLALKVSMSFDTSGVILSIFLNPGHRPW